MKVIPILVTASCIGAIAGLISILVLKKKGEPMETATVQASSQPVLSEDLAEIYFAGGCFWGTEKYFGRIQGVISTDVGYANGSIENPTYEQVCSKNTGFAEAVHVTYDPTKAPLDFLLDLYYKTIDPTTINRQCNDTGSQYRTGIYYVEEADRSVIDASLKELAKQYEEPIAVECKALENYYLAEDYHQNYLDKNPAGYCHIGKNLFEEAKKAVPVSEETYQKPSDQELKQLLTPEQYDVVRNNVTERPFENQYHDFYEAGIYVDITTGQPLFVSTDKFESGCGWPSFSKPIDQEVVAELTDNTLGMLRTEVRSQIGDAHLGHVFKDGPKESGGLRYCINSASLRFIPKDQLGKEGYGKYLDLVK